MRLSIVAALVSGPACSSGGAGSTGSPSSGAAVASASSDASSASATASGDANSAAAQSAAALGRLTVGSDALFQDQGAIVEGFDDGSAAFAFAPDGPVKVAAADGDGKTIGDRTATLTYTIPETGKTLEVPLHPDADKHYLVANGPELGSVVTPVHYEIKGGPRTWTGVLQLPAGGTKALNDSAALAAKAHATPIVGPHGGTIERVGDDDVELLVDPKGNQVHGWVIVDNKPVDPKDRTLVALLDDHRVELAADANAGFSANVAVDAGFSLGALHKVTGVVTRGKSVWAVEYGFRPHTYVYAPRITIAIAGPGSNAPKIVVASQHGDDDGDKHGDDHGDHGDKHGDDHGDHGDKHGDDHGDHGDKHGDDHGDHGHAGHGDGNGHGKGKH